VLLSPGVKAGVGPHRLYRKLAPAFLAHGIAVMRVDFHGLGDSEGEWPDDRLQAIYHMTELGACVEDAGCALDWLQAHRRISKVIVGGLCGAAITGLLLAEQDRRVSAVYAVGFPTRAHCPGKPARAATPQGVLHFKRRVYLRKILQPASWLRLLSLRSDYRLMGSVLADLLKPRRARESAPSASPGLNPRVLPALFASLRSKVPALLLFGEHDPLRFDFDETVARPWRQALARHPNLLDVKVIPGADHVLSDPEAVAQARLLTGQWLRAQFQAARMPRAAATSCGRGFC